MTLKVYVFPILWTAKDVFRQISEKPSLRTSFSSQHVKGSQTLLKSARKNFYHINSSLCGSSLEHLKKNNPADFQRHTKVNVEKAPFENAV